MMAQHDYTPAQADRLRQLQPRRVWAGSREGWLLAQRATGPLAWIKTDGGLLPANTKIPQPAGGGRLRELTDWQQALDRQERESTMELGSLLGEDVKRKLYDQTLNGSKYIDVADRKARLIEAELDRDGTITVVNQQPVPEGLAEPAPPALAPGFTGLRWASLTLTKQHARYKEGLRETWHLFRWKAGVQSPTSLCNYVKHPKPGSLTDIGPLEGPLDGNEVCPCCGNYSHGRPLYPINQTPQEAPVTAHGTGFATPSPLVKAPERPVSTEPVLSTGSHVPYQVPAPLPPSSASKPTFPLTRLRLQAADRVVELAGELTVAIREQLIKGEPVAPTLIGFAFMLEGCLGEYRALRRPDADN